MVVRSNENGFDTEMFGVFFDEFVLITHCDAFVIEVVYGVVICHDINLATSFYAVNVNMAIVVGKRCCYSLA